MKIPGVGAIARLPPPSYGPVQKCTISEAQRVTGDVNWNVTLHELDKFIDLIITRGVLGQMGLPYSSLFNTSWGCPRCSVIPFPGTGSRK